jgi:hypothetical protein
MKIIARILFILPLVGACADVEFSAVKAFRATLPSSPRAG